VFAGRIWGDKKSPAEPGAIRERNVNDMKMMEKLFGTYSDRELKRIYPIVDKIEALEEDMKQLTDEQLRGKTAEFKERLANGETLDDLLPEAFAVVREAADRVLGQRHFRVQLIGGIILHQGRIAEMKTGEGKTLVSTLPAYLNALTGKGVHIVTVNDYLANYASELMGKVHRFLGLTVGLIVNGLDNNERQKAYAADITYGTNNELGFDYLRDNMVIYKEQMVQRGHNYAIVDEIDSILIDEARTPLIISGAGDKSTDMYTIVDRFVARLTPIKRAEFDSKENFDDLDGDYLVDEKQKTVTLTQRGIKKAEEAFHIDNLSDPENMALQHHINQAIRAHGIMRRDIDYVVKDGEVLIVDEFTGRIMIGRRYSEGLHQAIEAKEGVKVERESKTLATITFQNYFRLYDKLAGMTGTALTEEQEFREIYGLDVVEVPTNRPMIRKDLSDVVYKTEDAKFRAVVEQIKECYENGQPVLVGTISIEKSELLSKMLKKQGIPHQVLNAKFHDKEAQIIAQAGKSGAVTIATNMAGRGTDIMLGGNAEYLARNAMEKDGYEPELIFEATGFAETDDEEVLNARKVYQDYYEKFKEQISDAREEVIRAGGLFIVGTERHESRRIDNQLRGRAGRQGDPGSSRFFISLEDDLMRLFGSDRVKKVVETMGLEDDEPIEHNMLTKAISTAQSRIEGRNFESRKHVLQYDEVMNQQRKIIYSQRQQVLDGEDLKENITNMIEEYFSDMVDRYTAGDIVDDWNLIGLASEVEGILFEPGEFAYKQEDLDSLERDDLKERILERAMEKYKAQEELIGAEQMREVERVIMLQNVDRKWMDHIDSMDQLKRGITLRAYAQRDPVVEYKYEGMDMFEEMINSIKEDTARMVLMVKFRTPPQREQVAKPTTASHGGEEGGVKKTVVKKQKVGRNDPCPCGSGKKYKKCCGMNEE